LSTVKCVSIDSGGHRARVLQARDALIEQHLGLVPPIAGRIHAVLPPSFEFADLVQTGLVALLHAAVQYRPDEHREIPFHVFARPLIRFAIIDSVRRKNYREATHLPIDAAPVRKQVSTVEQDISVRQIREYIETADDITEQQREILKLHYSPAELTFVAIGRQLGLAEWKVLNEHGKAMKAIRRLFQAA
jgi:RNA polymerase sigma factor (sigma-70 family)